MLWAPICLLGNTSPTLAVTDAAFLQAQPLGSTSPRLWEVGSILIFILMRESALNPATVPVLPQGQCMVEQVPTGSRAPLCKVQLHFRDGQSPGLSPRGRKLHEASVCPVATVTRAEARSPAWPGSGKVL